MSEINAAFQTTVEKLWEEKKYTTLRDVLSTMQPAQVADLLSALPENAPAMLFRLMPKELAADTFVEMEPDMQEALIKSFSDTELKGVLNELYMDDAVDLVEEMPANVVRRILAQADPEMRKSINELLKYPEDSAGSIMTTEFVALLPHMTAADAITSIRRTGMDKETVNTCYVIDQSRKLLGVVTLRTIVMAREDQTMEELMEENVVSVGTLEDQETVAHMFSDYNLNVLPVVDKENRLVGIVTVDDAIAVMEEEATEDISQMAAITPTDKPYLKTSVFTLYKSRIPWLLLLMLSATFTGMIITHFEDTLSFSIALTAAIPMLMDT
ncbi:MAG: magnesium transporter, partial [Clostridia bacterium]|nr:magnesium transporter [Clostridia bacterium]